MTNKMKLIHHVLDKYENDGKTQERINTWLDPIIAREINSEVLEGVEPNRYQSHLIYVLENSQSVLGMLVVKGAPKLEIDWVTKTIRDTGLAYYRMVFNAGKSVPISIDLSDYSAKGRPTDCNLGLDDWVLVFATTLILQDYDAAYELCEMNEAYIDMDIRPTGSDSRSFDKAMLNLFKGILYPDADMNTLLTDAAEKVFQSECVGHEQRQETVNYKYLPLISLIHAMYSPNRETAYPEKLQEALADHKAFFSQNEYPFDYAYESVYWIALTITGLAALAYHRWGLEPTVDTLYMPEWMVKELDIRTPRRTYEEVFGNKYDCF
ncbi:Imm49 family immunity protein [Photobacterium kasasachensis]|uniref:Imm49 family immunity protein n=1 Tax=Photobacterium kasasachensis TaxID=2910240 RepID=UPI003D0F8E38